MTTRETIVFTLQTFVGKGMSLLFNTLSRFVIVFFTEQASFNFRAAVSLNRQQNCSKEIVIPGKTTRWGVQPAGAQVREEKGTQSQGMQTLGADMRAVKAVTGSFLALCSHVCLELGGHSREA